MYVERRQHDRAVADLREAMRLDAGLSPEVDPILGLAYYHVSVGLQKQGQKAEAAEALHQARKLNPTYVRERDASPAANDQELASVPPALEQTPNRIEVFRPVQEDLSYQQGLQLLKQQSYDEAIRKLNAAVKADPRHGEAYLARGIAFLEKGFPDTALADLGQSILYDRTNAEAFCQRARAYAALGNHPAAIRDCSAAIRWDAELNLAYQIRARCYIKDGKLQRARADIDEVIRLDPSQADTLLPVLSQACRDQGIEDVGQRALEEKPQDPSTP